MLWRGNCDIAIFPRTTRLSIKKIKYEIFIFFQKWYYSYSGFYDVKFWHSILTWMSSNNLPLFRLLLHTNKLIQFKVWEKIHFRIQIVSFRLFYIKVFAIKEQSFLDKVSPCHFLPQNCKFKWIINFIFLSFFLLWENV